MISFVFPGQGSQKIGMGEDLFGRYPELTAKADHILGYSIQELCRDGERLNQTQFTQPALYVVNALSYLKKTEETGLKPDFTAGHSLGEYNALYASGVFDFEEGLQLVKKRGELMSRAKGGGMAAVIGLTHEQVTDVLRENHLDMIDIANMNTPQQIVISGYKEDIEKAASVFEAVNGVKMVHRLNVSGAFHSRYMLEAKEEFSRFIESFHFKPLSIPVISNVTARPYEQRELKETLTGQITGSVNWTDSIRFLMGRKNMSFEEIGPGKVLTGLIQRITAEAEPITDEIKVPAETGKSSITAASLGNEEFKRDYQLKYAYLAGGMYRGISSKEMVVKLAEKGMMGFFGTGGLNIAHVEDAILSIQHELRDGGSFGINVVHNMKHTDSEEKMIDLLLKHGVQNLEASAFLTVTPALVRFRAKGLKRGAGGQIIARQRIIAKLSRPEVAEAFLSPAPDHILQKLAAENKITAEEASLMREIPVAHDICVEADSGGHTDGGVAYSLMPAIIRLRDDMMKKYRYGKTVRIGAAGGIGTPEAAMAAFMLGADFIVTGSINQCTVEAATSGLVKDLLQQMNVQDTAYAPAGDMFESGSKVQVLKKGLFFPTRASKLHELYQRHRSIEEIDEKTLRQIEEKYFKASVSSIYDKVKAHYSNEDISKAERNPKQKMALIFKWYFRQSSASAIKGDPDAKVDFQIHCGPALGAFNQWVKGTELESWKNRHADDIGMRLMEETASLLNQKLGSFLQTC
ncbi:MULTISPECIES: ACP S-malonyltransferase [Bacillus]|uniref:ACP S-malonyltransferase n=1 Tax=Bacillus TaxID=1386 RepID=UPI000BA6FFFC|nr:MULTISPECIES: ACP S-malonyltransferase [Bacillus]MDH3081102.1 ACP S-malonyltransferase [Bacillus amyloliquefaciens]MDU0074475.1 ACP S-malonyltransferase [Bacillus sp. IG2]MDU0100185.1 ACP S-malonyltransferase [Bacillus sp. IS1]MEC2271907.1 ACP S-malonyltransferase [Bacillus velezensis]MED3679902.1 ACP S-malonyltransferase [Bacillus velezensis]